MLRDKEGRKEGRKEVAMEKAVGFKSTVATALKWQYEWCLWKQGHMGRKKQNVEDDNDDDGHENVAVQ